MRKEVKIMNKKRQRQLKVWTNRFSLMLGTFSFCFLIWLIISVIDVILHNTISSSGNFLPFNLFTLFTR